MESKVYKYDRLSLFINIVSEVILRLYIFFIILLLSIIPAILFNNMLIFLLAKVINVIVFLFIVVKTYLDKTIIEIHDGLISITKIEHKDYEMRKNIRAERRSYGFTRRSIYFQLNIIIPISENEVQKIKCFGLSEEVNLELERYINVTHLIENDLDEIKIEKNEKMGNSYNFTKKEILERLNKLKILLINVTLFQFVYALFTAATRESGVSVFPVFVIILCIVMVLYYSLIISSINGNMPETVDIVDGKIIFDNSEIYIGDIKKYTHNYNKMSQFGHINLKDSNKSYSYKIWIDRKSTKSEFELLTKKLDSILQ